MSNYDTGTKIFPVVGDTFGIDKGIEIEVSGNVKIEVSDGEGVILVVRGSGVILTGSNPGWVYKVVAVK